MHTYARTYAHSPLLLTLPPPPSMLPSPRHSTKRARTTFCIYTRVSVQCYCCPSRARLIFARISRKNAHAQGIYYTYAGPRHNCIEKEDEGTDRLHGHTEAHRHPARVACAARARADTLSVSLSHGSDDHVRTQSSTHTALHSGAENRGLYVSVYSV